MKSRSRKTKTTRKRARAGAGGESFRFDVSANLSVPVSLAAFVSLFVAALRIEKQLLEPPRPPGSLLRVVPRPTRSLSAGTDSVGSTPGDGPSNA